MRQGLALVPLGVELLGLSRAQSRELALDAVPGVLGVALRALVARGRRVRRLEPRLQRLDLRRHALAVARASASARELSARARCSASWAADRARPSASVARRSAVSCAVFAL